MKIDMDAWKWAIGIIFAGGMLYAQLTTVPKLAEKVQSHEVRLSVVESNLGDIKEGISNIKRMMEHRNRSGGM